MTDPTARRIHIPQWGRCVIAGAFLFSVCILLIIGIPTYRRHAIISHFRAKGCTVTSYADWEWADLLPVWFGDNLNAMFYQQVWIYEDNGYEITDADLPELSGLTSLAWMRLQRGVSDAGLVHLAGMRNLRYLELLEAQITDSGLPLIMRLPKIERLDLRGTKVTDAGLNHLKGTPSLRHLYIDSDPHGGFTDTGLANISALGDLEHLAIEGDLFTDRGMAHVSRMKNLRYLHLGARNITDKGLAELGKLVGLETLFVYYTNRVTAAGIATLQAALPKCKILIQGDLAQPISGP